jgi:hypothetical protein
MQRLRIELEERHEIELKPIYIFFLWDSQRHIMGDKKKKKRGHLDLKGLEYNKHKPQKLWNTKRTK